MSALTRILFLFQIGLCLLLCCSAIAMAQTRQPGDLTPVYVYMNFEGDPNFPSITYQHNTKGLGVFTGAPFVLPSPSNLRDTLVQTILQRVRQRYGDYDNIFFVTDANGLDFFYTLGIDNSAYIYSTDDCKSPSGYCRLYGKAGPHPNPFATDESGESIFHPTFARTWAGSFALDSPHVKSKPPLIFGESYQNVPGVVDIDKLANALGNNASHEIAHLLGVDDSDDGLLMNSQIEALEVRNKCFGQDAAARLQRTLVEAATIDFLEPNDLPGSATAIDPGIYRLTLDHPYDEDFFTYTVPEDSPGIMFAFSHDFAADNQTQRELVIPSVKYRDCVGCPHVQGTIQATDGGRRFVDHTAPAGREYFLHVFQLSPMRPVVYTMTVGLAPDRFEPNDALLEAADWLPRVCDFSGELNIHDMNDQDFYSIGAEGFAVEATLLFDPTYGNINLNLDGTAATEVVSMGALRFGASLVQKQALLLLVYDEDRDITWLRDTSSRGLMTFAQAQEYAAELNAARFMGGTGWRLPMIDLLDSGCSGPFATGLNCTGGEPGHLYYDELGNQPGPPPDGGLTQRGPFGNLEANIYWTGTEDALGDVWFFNFFNGFQDTGSKLSSHYAWLVHDGDLSPNEPSLRQVRVVGCGESPSIVEVSGDQGFYDLCIKRMALQQGCDDYIEFIPFVGSGTFDYRVRPPFTPGFVEVHGDIQRQMFARLIKETSNKATWQIAAFVDYGFGLGQPVQGTLEIPKPEGAGRVPFSALVIATQPGLRDWFQVEGVCTAGRTDLVNCNADSQCDTSLNQGDGICQPLQSGDGGFTGPVDAIESFDVTSGIDGMFWNVFKPDERGTLTIDGMLDSDGDGIANEVELATGTDPFDADTDDDGIPDGDEDTNGNGKVDSGGTGTGNGCPGCEGNFIGRAETDPRLWDTDGDGISDGVESGLSIPKTPDTNLAVFRGDSDPLSTTDPTNVDTDGDGLPDGVEDADHDGQQDPGETSPLVRDRPEPDLGDIDADGDVDRDDLNAILAARNTPASGSDDPRDLDADGMITALDARKCVTMCTRPRCACE
jgi:uncharacterized protein DUF1566/thrombospondin type 3 repeat protein